MIKYTYPNIQELTNKSGFISWFPKMESNFDSVKYLELLKTELQTRAENIPGKLYVEINGKLLKDDFASRIFDGYELDLKKKLITQLKNECEILVCIHANHIIENTAMTKKDLPCIQHLELTLKRIETATGIRPQLVITHINMENMYDIIFSIESKFQKKGYKVWEQYEQKGFPLNKRLLLSENGFWNNDHIPIQRKIVLVTGIGNESGKLATCLSQLYCDHEIGIESSFCMFQTLPLTELAPEHPINQARAQKRKNELLTQDDFWETIEDSSQESFSIIKNLFTKYLPINNPIHEYKKVGDMIICPTLSCLRELTKAEEAAKKELTKTE